MSQSLSARLWATIEQHLPAGASGEVLVAFSGGLDSTALLHALLDNSGRRPRVRTVHVDHGLHPDAHQWLAHCARVANELRVPFVARQVNVPIDAADGIESAARAARYEALRIELRAGETLLTAHHADDQLETVLLALMRGSGVDGLAGMPLVQRLGSGWHMRPLLVSTRIEITAWANERALRWIEDPSNAHLRFDRNYLRNEVIPSLRSRWPSVATAAVRAAGHLGEAAGLIDHLAARDLAAASVGSCLKVNALRTLDAARRRNVLRYWLHSCGARAPSTRKLAALEHDMLVAHDDRTPCVDYDDVEVRRHRGLMYCLPRRRDEASLAGHWSWTEPYALTCGSGLLRAEIAHGCGLARTKLPTTVHVRRRVGGETLRLPGHVHRRPLKKLLQEASVLPWWRDRLPLLYAGDQLIAVADMWVSADYAADPRDEGVRIIWEQRPRIEAIAAL